jgi:hypothetical protein
MRRNIFVYVSLALGAGGLLAEHCVAQDPAERLDHYRVVPRLSRLRLTGGFAGFNALYRVSGEYDFRRHASPNGDAAFESAEVWGSIISDDPAPAVVIDVDEVLDLEGLTGMALPVAAPFDVYRFHSNRPPDEPSVELFAAVIGPWIFLRGGTMPPPGGADFFNYHIRALARSSPFADINEDGTVDAADYVALRSSGQMGGGEGMAGYAEWRQQFGETAPDMDAVDRAMSAAVGSYLAAAAVPEPASLMLAVCAGVLIVGVPRRR